MSTSYRVRFWGVRGSMPTPHLDRIRYGGNTSCVEMALSPQRRIVFDAGTGIRDLGQSLVRERPGGPREIHLFLTHYHYDHIQGLPFFSPLHEPGTSMTLHGPRPGGTSTTGLGPFLESFVGPPLFPVSLAGAPCRTSYVEIGAESVTRIEDVTITTVPLHHPQGAVGFRVERGPSTLLYLTDHEHGDGAADAAILAAAKGAGTLIIDSQFTPDQYATHHGWGHGTWRNAVAIAEACDVGRLVLYHHNPHHSDDEMDRILAEARALFPRTDAAFEGMELDF